MKYSKPEIEIMEMGMVDVIQTSAEPGENGTPIVPFSSDGAQTLSLWEK